MDRVSLIPIYFLKKIVSRFIHTQSEKAFSALGGKCFFRLGVDKWVWKMFCGLVFPELLFPEY